MNLFIFAAIGMRDFSANELKDVNAVGGGEARATRQRIRNQQNVV